MGRHKTISDDEVLLVARAVFRAHGPTASTRQVADAAGISEAVLYQRFSSKNELFFAAMHSGVPDVEELLGPVDPPDDARAYLHTLVVRLGRYFADVIPLALQLLTHPSFDRSRVAHTPPRGPTAFREHIARQLASLARRKRIVGGSEKMAARLLVSLAHDWALGIAMAHGSAPANTATLKKMVDVVWRGLRPG